jgi:[acyl-carrier-protein] S-malonyltransferase
MQHAVPVNVGGMAALMGAELDEVKTIVDEVKKSYVCDIANYNTKTQIVLSGEKKGITRAIDLAKEKKIRTIELPVSAPFHCSLMQKTAEELKDYFNKLNFRAPEIDIISNYSARTIHSIDELKELLYKQTFSTVKWYESILFMKSSGINDYFEIGYGNVLSGINKRIDKELKTFSMNNIADIEEVVKKLS